MSDDINSYNAGYHRGLNTEYHDRDINELFKEWIFDVRRPATEAVDPVAFEKGYQEGLDDYAAWKERGEILEDRVHKDPGRGRAARTFRVLTADEIVAVQPMTAPTKIKFKFIHSQDGEKE